MEEKIINVLDDEFDTEVLKSDKPVLVELVHALQNAKRGSARSFPQTCGESQGR